MTGYRLGIKVPPYGHLGGHDPSAVLSKDGEILFGIEQERISRIKHGTGDFPKECIEYCIEEANISIEELDDIILSYSPELQNKTFLRRLIDERDKDKDSILSQSKQFLNILEDSVKARYFKNKININQLEEFGELPEIKNMSHHKCHAASAFYPSKFDEALVVTIDGAGEFDSTVVWKADEDSLERLKTWKFPNSLGKFYGAVTEFLGYHANNGEGKIMGLAPYGKQNKEIEKVLEQKITIGEDYDVSSLTRGTWEECVARLEDLFDKDRKEDGEEGFSQWEKDLAYTTQRMVENTVKEVVSSYIESTGCKNVCLAGGVALNCKMNKEVMEIDEVENIFIQPVSSDAGLPIGAVYKGMNKSEAKSMDTVYWGPSYDSSEIEELLEKYKLKYRKPENLEREAAKKLSEGNILGWFQGRMEMGPRALGNRSILADPRTSKSRDRVNKYVKNREDWRPFCPSMLEEAADEYLVNAEKSPYMIKTFDVREEKHSEISAALHPGDNTTRPQTVNKNQNERYWNLIKEFEEITDVPVILNTSFNDHGEPIVNTPKQAIKDFFAMGMDYLIIEDYLISK